MFIGVIARIVERKNLQEMRWAAARLAGAMSQQGFTRFDTAIGRCGLAWGPRGIVTVQLPERSAGAARARLLGRLPGAREAPPPPAVEAARDGIAALLRGEPADLSRVALDMEGLPPFPRRVYEAARTIPPGATLRYGELAARLGAPREAREVGQALARNPFPLIVPCHRVVAAGGRIGGFSAPDGVALKLRLLAIEGARTSEQPPLFEDEPVLGFDPDAAAAHLRAADPALARIIDRVGPLRLALKRTPSTFGALAEAIVHQQLSGRAAATIHSRLCALFPRPLRGPTADQLARVPDAALRAAGLSEAKQLALRDLASRARAGDVPELEALRRMEDEEIVAKLSQVRGIGRWTVEMLLIFRLGRPDVLPCEDLGVRKGLAFALRRRALPAPDALRARGERWRPYRTAASVYLWRAAELAARE
jgi:methylated-DNA-[protein]-cysteine S-methyltransferase